METANEWEGDNPARSTTTSEQIADGPPARDSENNESLFKEDTLQQMLTCETGNTGMKASAPPCDKETSGQGLHGTSPAKDNLDTISLIQLEAPEVAEAYHLEAPEVAEAYHLEGPEVGKAYHLEGPEVAEAYHREGPMDLEVTSSDESGDWETASEASVAYEESTNVKGEKQDESLDGNENMDICSAKETGDCLELQTPGGNLEKSGSEVSEGLAEEQIRTYSKGEQAFTHGTISVESLYDGKTENGKMPPHPEEALGEGTVIEESDPNVEGTVTEKSYFVNTEFHIEKLTDEASCIGGPVTHVDKSELHDEEAVNEWTRPHQEKGSHDGEGAIMGIEAPFESNMDLQTSLPATEQDQSQVRELTCEVREPQVEKTGSHVDRPHDDKTGPHVDRPHVDKTGPHIDKTGSHVDRPHVDKTGPHIEEIIHMSRESLKVTESENLDPDGNMFVRIEAEPYVVKILIEQCSPPMEEAIHVGTGNLNEEPVSDHGKSDVEEVASVGIGHRDEEIFEDHAKFHAEDVVGDGTGHPHDEEMARDHSKSQPEELGEKLISSAELNEHCVKEMPNERSGTCINESDYERTVTYDEAYAIDQKGACIAEIVPEGTEVENNIEETKSKQTMSAEIEGSSIKITEKSNDSGYVLGKEQSPLDTSSSKEAGEKNSKKVNNEEVGDSQPTINKVFNVNQKETAKDEIDITEVSEETSSKVPAQDLKEGTSPPLDDIEDIVNKETEGASTETVYQEMIGAIAETAGTEVECVYKETAKRHTEEPLIQGTFDTTRGTVIEDTLADSVDSDCKERDNGSLKVVNDETLYMKPVEDVHVDSRDSPEYETTIQTIESVYETPTVHHKEMLGTVKETSDFDSIERQNEKVTNFVGTIEHIRETKNVDDAILERMVIEPSSEEQELGKRRAKQESEELLRLKELDGEIPEMLPNIQNLHYESEHGEDEISWNAEGIRLHALKEDIQASWMEGEGSDKNVEEAEANLTFSEHQLKEETHKRLLDVDNDQAVSNNDGISYMDITPDKGTKIDTVEQVPLDETTTKEMEGVESEKYPSPTDMEISNASGMVIKPLPVRPMVFSKDSFQNLNVVEEPNLPNFQMGDGVESLGASHQKDFTDFENREQNSPLGETMSNRLQTETIEDQVQIPGVIQVARIVGIQFSEGHEELAEDQPDCFNQGSIFDKGLENSSLLPQAKPFTKPETDESFGQEAMLTVAPEPDLSDITLCGGPVVGDQGTLDSSIKTVQHADGARVDRLPILITRQRSNTDPCLIYDQEEEDNTQQDDHHEKGKPRPRLRSVTPPLDNFTVSFTAIKPQAILGRKSLEKEQTSVVYPGNDYNISEEQRTEEQKTQEAKPKHHFTFVPTQIFNPLFFIKEGQEEHGFYQDRPLLPPVKESINKRRVPSPPRDTEVPMRAPHPQTIGKPDRSPASSRTTMMPSTTDPSADQPVTPRWLPPRPLRHTDSAVGKDFRPLKPTENHLVRRRTVRFKNSSVAGPALKQFSAMNLPTIPQGVPSADQSSLGKSSRHTGSKVHIANTTRPLMKLNEQDVAQPKNKSPMERLAEAVEKSPRSPEAVLKRREKHSQIEPSTSDTTSNMHRRYSNFIHSYSLLYQEYSDVALNQEIQRQKPGDSPAEEKDPGSPRQRRRLPSSQDSYLQRLSISSADSLWQDIPKVRDSVTFMSMSREEQKLQEAKFELIMSEALYLRSLNIAVDHFQRSTELQEVLSAQDRQWLFSRLSEVRDASNVFLSDLEEEFENNVYKFQVCDVVIAHEPTFRKVYLPYVTNQTYQERTFQRLMNGNPRFQQVLSKLESDPVCQRLSLKSFLILPFQRITRLRLLLQNILKRSAPASNEELQATEGHNAIEKLIRDCNEGVQKMKDTEELILLHQKIQFECKIFPLISASRRLVKHGEVTSLEFNPISFKWKGTTRQVYLHLFSDCLLLSRIREGGRFVVFDHASDFRVERCEIKLHSNQKNIFRVFLKDSAATQARDGYVEGQEMEYIFRTETQSQKLRWIYALSPPKRQIDFLRDGLPQVQCLKSYKARENDELSLEKADILMVTQNSDDGWLCGIRLSDLHSGWFPQCQVHAISRNACLRNLEEEKRLQDARAKLHPTGTK